MRTIPNSAALAAAAILAGAGLLAACDKSAQSGDGATGKGEVGTAAYTPNGQVVPTGANDSKLNAPEVTNDPNAAGQAADAAGAEKGHARSADAGAAGGDQSR